MTKSKLADQFSKRVRAILAARGWHADEVVRKSPRLKSAAVQRWIDGARFPRPGSIVDLANALSISPKELLKGLDVPMRTLAEVEAIDRASH